MNDTSAARYQRLHALLDEAGERRIDLAGVGRVLHAEFDPKSPCRVVHLARLGCEARISRIDQTTDQFGRWNELAQDFEPLRSERVEEKAGARRIAARPVQALDNA
jgi:hypothetical protein